MKRLDEGLAFLLRYENIAWYDEGKVRILDRRVYPMETRFVTCTRHEEVAQAIHDMVTQSMGPYFTAGMGMTLAAWEVKDESADRILSHLRQAAYTLSHARPTTTAKMQEVTARALAVGEAAVSAGKSGQALVDAMMANAIAYNDWVYETYDKVGINLASVIPHNGTVMTQCYGETVIGTFLRECRRQGSDVKVICPETRPYFQGARLTASVACDQGFDVTVISDNMPAYVMKEKNVDLFTSAADIITVDGHVINKIGTFQIALAASYWGIPYYTTGRPDPSHKDLSTVVIEQRDPLLVMDALGKRTTMEGVKGFYPAFDITPPKLIDGIITDKGIYAPMNLTQYFKD